MILLDTSFLVDSLSGGKNSGPALYRVLAEGEEIVLPALTLYEWLRGPRLPEEIAIQQKLFPDESAIPFGPQEAALSAKFYRALSRTRGREIDLGIAACAILRDCSLWTLNPADFKDVPGLKLYRSAS